MAIVSMSTFLRRALAADALVSGVAGAAMVLGASLIAPLTGLPPALLVAAGVALFPWTVALLWLARKPSVSVVAVWSVIVLNVLWVADSAWIALGGAYQPNAQGLAFIAVQAVAVIVFAEFEFIGLRRAAPVSAPRQLHVAPRG